MTHPNPKDPQADIQAIIDRHTGEWKAGHNHLIVEQVMAVFQAREQEIFTELVAKKAYHRCEGGWFEHVPLEVIERLQNKTNDGGSDE